MIVHSLQAVARDLSSELRSMANILPVGIAAIATAQLNGKARVTPAQCCKIDIQQPYSPRRHIPAPFPHSFLLLSPPFPNIRFSDAAATSVYVSADTRTPLQVGFLPPQLQYQHLSTNPLQILLQNWCLPASFNSRMFLYFGGYEFYV